MNRRKERYPSRRCIFTDDDWCRFYDTDNTSDCNCNVAFARYVEPVRL